ncbi:MAG: hypothetical protein LBR57_00705 [Alistipes sp.]|jgi:hypothetical protein|nr:hypothetical protein [Alistipes sp.]
MKVMVKSGLKHYLARLSGALLLLTAAGSCTYDYFEDETNFRLYVPQIKNREITNFYVSFHRLDGKDTKQHVITRQVSAPFDDNELLATEGIMKFKLPPGKYEISTFADYNGGMITVGEHFDASRKVAASYGEENVYAVTESRPRALFLRNTQVYPINAPETYIPVEADIDESCLFKAGVTCRFIDLPENVTSAVVTYGGLATTFDFRGVFGRFTPDDVLRQSHPFTVNGEQVIISDLIYPSVGVGHGAVDDHTDNGLGIELSIVFYGGTSRVGEASFTSADLSSLPEDKLPTRNDEVVRDLLVLYPRDQVEFVFKDWFLTGIDLVPWEGIDPGEVVIH